MIEVKDQYRFVFSLGGSTDFLAADLFESFLVVEEAGNVPATWNLVFRATEERVLSSLNEGNLLGASYGPGSEGMAMAKLAILKAKMGKVGADQRRVSLSGISDAMGYVTAPGVEIIPGVSALEAVCTVAGRYFQVDADPKVSEDKQNWIRCNTSAKRFVNDTWLHADLTDSCPLIGITADGKFRVRDLKKAAGTVKWRLVRDGVGGDIAYSGDFGVDWRSGIMNSWFGYGREKMVSEIERGTQGKQKEELSSLLAMSDKLGRASVVPPRADMTGFQNENVHPKYWSSYLRNMGYLSAYSSLCLTVTVPHRYYPIQLLDTVYFVDPDVADSEPASSVLSGRYLVTKVVRSLSGMQLTTTLELMREGLNEMRGNLR